MYEEYDQDTTTSSDYTAMYKIPHQVFEEFCRLDLQQKQQSLQNQFQPRFTTQTQINRSMISQDEQSSKKSRAFRFKQYFINEVERILSSRHHIFDPDLKRVRIVDAVFAYQNSDLIKLLQKRGEYIIKSQNKELIEIEHKIQDYVKTHEN